MMNESTDKHAGDEESRMYVLPQLVRQESTYMSEGAEKEKRGGMLHVRISSIDITQARTRFIRVAASCAKAASCSSSIVVCSSDKGGVREMRRKYALVPARHKTFYALSHQGNHTT